MTAQAAADLISLPQGGGAVQGLVAAGVGYAVVPRLTVDPGDPATRVVEVAGIPPREIALAWHADRTLSPAARVFVEVVGELLDDCEEGTFDGMTITDSSTCGVFLASRRKLAFTNPNWRKSAPPQKSASNAWP